MSRFEGSDKNGKTETVSEGCPRELRACSDLLRRQSHRWAQVRLGAIDLYSQQSLLFKYEASITDVVTGLFFAASIFAEKTVMQEFRENDGNAKPMTRDRVAYFKILTAVWAAYFFLKAGAYFWIASKMSLEQGLFIRTVLGSSSFYAMLFISIVGSKKIFPIMKRWNLLPPAES